MIEFVDASKVYKRGLLDTYALRNLSVHIGRGDFVYFAGASGSGKTTFLSIAGLIEGLTRGRYRLDGIDVTRLGDAARSRLRRDRIGFVFQHCNFVSDLTLAENLDMALRYRNFSAPERARMIDRAFGKVGNGCHRARYPNELSSGELRLAAVARALAGNPRLLLADEPTANLDLGSEQHVLAVLKEINHDGTTVVIAAHHIGDGKARHYFSSGILFTDRSPSSQPQGSASALTSINSAL